MNVYFPLPSPLAHLLQVTGSNTCESVIQMIRPRVPTPLVLTSQKQADAANEACTAPLGIR